MPKTTTEKPTPRRRRRLPDERFRDQLCKTVIALPLLEKMQRASKPLPIIIDLNYGYLGGLRSAKKQACLALLEVLDPAREVTLDTPIEALLQRLPRQVDRYKTELCPQYVFARLTPEQIRAFITIDDRLASALIQRGTAEAPSGEGEGEDADLKRPFAHDVATESSAPAFVPHYRGQSIYKLWPDFRIEPMMLRTVSTVKADAARIAFSAGGRGIVWAVVDSGIDAEHAHFAEHKNLELPAPLRHADFTRTNGLSPYVDVPIDEYGHGTHVAGIIAGELKPGPCKKVSTAVSRVRDHQGSESYEPWPIDRIVGVAPECKLLSLKVLDKRGRDTGRASNILAALAYINELNAYGRNIQVHGVNLSVGYEFEAEWFGCGQSPLCIEVNRLVSSGVVVVAAAGNTGYGTVAPSASGPCMAGLSLTINDPGNAERAITVGSTHRYMPQQYGVSYFSSKGPTGDGRLKPDLVAPGENVLSCAAGAKRKSIEDSLAQHVAGATPAGVGCDYLEESGTSMAAPHVSGAIAAFLSIRPGYIGCPDDVKKIFLTTATDLGRQREFQGHGLVDLMRAIQSV